MPTNSINLRLLEYHARLTAEARTHLLCQRFDPHLQQPIYGEVILPKFSGRALGCRIWDILERPFIDWSGSFESNLLGHRHPAVVEAIKYWALDEPVHELDEPATCDGPLTDSREISIAKQLAELFGEDMLVGFNRGRHEAIYSATEMARTITGRPSIAVLELHSQRVLHSEDQRFRFMRSHFEEENVKQIAFGDFAVVQWLLKSNPEKFAAVVMAPPAYETPPSDYFQKLNELLKEHGTLLILDESETAFRMELGGAQQHYSIRPDITVLGETLGGPFSFSAIVGRKELLSRAWRSTLRSLDRPGGLTLDTVEATLKVVQDRCLPSELKHTGGQLKEEFNDFASANSIPCQLVGHATRLSLQFDKHDFLTPEQLRAAFCMMALEEGVITHGEFWPNASHDGDALFETIRSLERASKSFAQWIADVAKPEDAIGEPFAKFEIRGRIDVLNMIRKTMVVSGWILIDGHPVELSATNQFGERVTAEKVTRTDLEMGMPDCPQAINAGFKLSMDVESIKKPSRFLIEAKRDGKLLYRTLLVHDPSEQTSAPYPFSDGYIFT